MEDECVRLADMVLSPSRSLLERVQVRLGGLASVQEVVEHPLYIDAPATLPTEATGTRGRLLYFGRIEHRKGVHLLVEAAELLLKEGVDLEVDFVGTDTTTGPCGRWFRGFLEEGIDERWRERFRFHGPKPIEQLSGMICGATACCFPSLWENYPNTCLEAMALGGVVVASDSGGMAEMLGHRVSGLLFRSNDVESLSGVLREVLSDSTLRVRLRRGAQQRARAICDPRLFAQRVEAALGQVAPVPTGASDGKHPKVSMGADVAVVVVHRDGPGPLKSTLGSIRAQTLDVRDLWVLAVGGAGPEVYSLTEGHGGTLHHTRQRSATAVRNIGLHLGSNRWVLFLDSGDVIESTFLEKTLIALEREPAAALATSLTWFFEKKPADGTRGWCPWGTGHGWIIASHPWARGSTLVEREEALRAGGYDEWVGDYDEWDLYCTLSERGRTGVVIPEFLIHRRVGEIDRYALATDQSRGLAALIAKHPGLAAADQLVARTLVGEVRIARAQASERGNSVWYPFIERLKGIMK